ncbi:flagellin [uncultured Nocardioides sp.]|uniref:flagellin N-terminal helical domain-containing protein n=2 Tax=uncultured Nocardioides sp. TaxID=198441 RepID=UPI000C633175|nr:flagellin [uncultured Nocardioides sp.]MAY98814.1 flagellin [Nocardioides sp.]MCK5927047.1 flagellin [Nocardioides sp.]|tara:strand:+ start:728 stop:1864 length:1137 start_codon:yes stop_codon:yes gene_type:complete
MSLRINQNIDAVNSYRNLSVTQGQMSKSLEKLSSGFRINRAADDAAGLAISEGLRSQIGGLKVAVRNTQDGVSVVQTAEGALTETHSILQRMRDLAVQSANDSNDSDSRNAINAEATALKSELTRIADKTTFNNVNLLDGSFTAKEFQVGYAANDTITVSISSGAGASGGEVHTTSGAAVSGADFTTADWNITQGGVSVDVDLSAATGTLSAVTTLNADAGFAANFLAEQGDNGELVITSKQSGVTTDIAVTDGAGATLGASADGTTGGFNAAGLGVDTIDLSSQSGATSAITALDTAIGNVSTARANLGALQNRFEHTINNLNVTSENLSASESRIRDTDMAQEMMAFTRSQILSQAGTAMLAQANQAPQSVLSLLR